MESLFSVAIAGALGSGARYLVSAWAVRRFGTSFPYGTLAVNVVGSFLMCLVMELAVHTSLVPVGVRLTITTGFLGGLTTYSTFNFEMLTLFGERPRARGFAYFAATLLGCFAAGVLGIVVARVVMR